MLFEPARHEALTQCCWNEAAVRAHIARIVAETHAAWRGEEGLWPIHPIDVSDERPDPMKTLYYGAAGVIWALEDLADQGAAARGRDYRPALVGLAPRVQADALRLTHRRNFGFLPGETGILMLQARLGLPIDEDVLAAAITAHRDDPSEGLLAGAPGVMLACLHRLESTGEDRWADLYRATADAVWDRWRYNDAAGCWLWRQDLYGDQAHQLGALHGYAGVAYVFLKGRVLLTPSRQAELIRRIGEAVSVTALREGSLVNWPFEAGGGAHPGSGALRVQHCVGAPGMINGLAGLPHDPETDALLTSAGELIWAAGPLAKHPCLCHGIPGSGFAFLKLHARTSDAIWLERARAFAMHAIGQNNAFTAFHGQRKYSLWTGDLGLALYLWACVAADAAFPTLDRF